MYGTRPQCKRRYQQAHCTPGRPDFNFNGGNFAKKSFPSKWDDEGKWLISSSCHEIKRKDVMTEMTPLGSSTTTRYNTTI
ncbi:hypothetical protein V6N13_105077 [Hibiscus sabdariffa]|uniref:Uncharacterized protein n=1 Tax=Hibiscus sabdariffa TaxID=183260 RepID=A0ABR2AHJ7_9ROSI